MLPASSARDSNDDDDDDDDDVARYTYTRTSLRNSQPHGPHPSLALPNFAK